MIVQTSRRTKNQQAWEDNTGWMWAERRAGRRPSYLVLHGLLLADQLGAQDQHLLLTDVQLLAGGGQLLQEHLVGGRARRSGAGRRVAQEALPHVGQVVFQLLVLRLQLLTLRSGSVSRGARH